MSWVERRLGSSPARLASALAVASVLAFGTLHAQIPGRNVNMVAGTGWPNGDPFLQRQNEPSIAASTRNPLHLLGGANDYRSVDIPGLPNGEETGDAWLGLFKSQDGGQRWTSTLLPGYPQDQSPQGIASPLKGYQAGADPVVRAGTSGLFYYSGLAFDRGDNGKSGIFVARFVDHNNREAGDPIAYIGTTLVASDSGITGDFLDKPWMAVDIPRGNNPKTCAIPSPAPDVGRRPAKPLRVPAGRVFVAFTSIVGDGATLRAHIYVSISDDCGESWSDPVRISRPEDEVNQGATIAIDPQSGAAYVAWRRFGLSHTADNDSIMVARLPAGAKKFDTARVARLFPTGYQAFSREKKIFEHRDRTIPEAVIAADVAEFDQGTTGISFRTNAYPTMAVDGGGRLYLAWSERGFSSARPDLADGDTRIVITTSTDGRTFAAPVPVDEDAQFGHQVMPTIAFSGGRLMLVYYDVRETRAQTFGPYVSDLLSSNGRRQTIDIRSAMGTPGETPRFGPSVKVSDYLMGYRDADGPLEQLQVNPPNLPMFARGSVPFIGDYIDVTPAPAFVPAADGRWIYNTASSHAQPVFHAVWTDNRDVRPPLDGNWSNYTPVTSPAITGPSIFDPTQQVPQCVPGNAGSRNQNIYSSRITAGLLAGSPGNSKTLSPTLQRGFVIFAQNNTTQTRTFRMTVLGQPVAGRASFTQFPLPPYSTSSPPPLTSIDLRVPARSTASRTLYVTSTDSRAQVAVDVSEIEGVGAPGPVPDGLSSTVLLNPDIDNPDIDNPDIDNPDIDNPDIDNAEVANPDIDNPDIDNPDIDNPDIDNPDIDNPDIDNVVVANPDIDNFVIENPDIDNPDIDNPDIDNPDIDNPDIDNGSITDITWVVTNNGNTTSAFNVNLFLASAAPAGIKTQLVLHKTYKTPAASPNGCELKTETRNVLVANITNPQFVSTSVADQINRSLTDQNASSVPDQNDPSESNATLWLGPGESGRITLRVVDPDRSDNITIVNERGETVTIDAAFNPQTQITPAVSSQAVPSEAAAAGVTEPPIVTPSGSNLFFLQQPTMVIEGQPITPTVRVRVYDNGGAALPGVTVTLALANNPTGATVTGNVAVTELDGIASFPDLQISAQGSGYTLTATANAGSVTATATTQPFTVSSPETPSADLQVTQSHAPSTPVTNTPFTYTVVVMNNGPLLATGVVLTDTLPAGFSVTSVVGTACAQGTGTVTCQLGSLAAGASAHVTITGMPTEAVMLVNTATVSSSSFDAIPVNNTSVDNTFAGAYGVCALPSFYGITNTHFNAFNTTNPFAAGDFNGDGLADVAVVSQFAPNSRGVAVMLGQGDGRFITPASNIIIGGNPQRVVATHVNGDGNLDLAVTVQNGATGSVVLLLGDGLGGFTAVASTSIAGQPLEIKAADIDHDEDVDLIVGNFTNSAPVSLLRGNGDGTFVASALPGSTDDVIAIADYNADGHLDIALVAQDLHALTVLDGDGEGGFSPSVAVPFTDFLSAAHPLADLNGDGRAELAVTTSVSTSASARLLVMTSNATGFNLPVEIQPPTLLRSSQILNAADVNGDGHEDLLVLETATNLVLVFQNTGLGGFAAPLVFPSDVPPSRLVVADVNGDGRPDLVISARLQPTIAVWINSCGGGASADIEATLVAPTTAVAGEIVEYTLTVTNHGPDAASNIRDGDGFTSGLVDIGEAVCEVTGGATCDGFIPMNGTITMTGSTQVLGAGVKRIRSRMTAPESDPNPANNLIDWTLTVSPAPLTFTVNTAADNVDGSLRDAIVLANQNTGAINRIEFNLPGPLPIVIQPLFPLPNITVPVIIDGTTQNGYNGTPVIELVGASAGSATGLTLAAGSGGSIVRGLAINGWNGSGIAVFGGNTTIERNFIGTDLTGAFARSNTSVGILVASANNLIGGTTPGAGNLVSGNGGTGILMTGAVASGNQVQGNRVGTNAAGTLPLPNANAGVQVFLGANNVIGGPTTAHANLISGGAINGVSLRGGATNNLVQGNMVGTNAAGTAALGNGGVGVIIGESSANTIVGNVISGNVAAGVMFVAEQAPNVANGNFVRGNRIGTDSTGTIPIGNQGPGVSFNHATAVSNNVIGGSGAGEGNVIAFNTIGVVVQSTGNVVRGNSIHSNTGLGIDLGNNGVTPNDPGDADSGTNNLQNFPVITLAGTGSTIVDGTFNSTPNTTFALDFYSSAACDASGFGEGRTYLGSISVATDPAGNATYHAVLTPTAALGEYITATATDPAGNTSEFSSCLPVTAPVAMADLAVTQTHSPTNPVTNTPFTYTITVTNNGPLPAAGVVLGDTLPSDFTVTNIVGACAQGTGTVSCVLGSIDPGTSTQVIITGTPTQAVGLLNTATVTSTTADSVPANNTSLDNTMVGEYGVCAVASFYGSIGSFYGQTNSGGAFANGDFNEDGKLDTAVLTNFGAASRGVQVMLGVGDGFFGAPTMLQTPGDAHGIAAADFDEDGNLDLAVSVWTTSGNGVRMFLGDGGGGFTAGPTTATGGFPAQLRAVDLNHDDHVDVIAASAGTSLNMFVLLGDGNANFTVSTAPTTTDRDVYAADFDNDGNLDLAAPAQGLVAVNVLRGDGAGGFTVMQSLTFAEVVNSIHPLADLNADGRPELALTMSPTLTAPARLMLMTSTGATEFNVPVELVAPSPDLKFVRMATSDLNGDGREDLLVTSFKSALVLQNNGLGSFAAPLIVNLDGSANQIAVADVNGDSRPDILSSSTQEGRLFTLLNTCGGGASADLEVTLTTPTTAAAGEIIDYTLIVTNHGPETATDVRDSDAIPTGVIDVDEGTCTASGGADCDTGVIPPNGSVTLTGQVRVLGAGVKTIRVSMTAPESDPDPSNNVATTIITVSPAPMTFTVTTATDNVEGSLRDAILLANQNTGATNRIEFNTPGTLPIVIQPQFALPTINNPVVVDGTTQPGYAGAPVVELTGVGTTGAGLILGAGSGGSTMRGLAINRWSGAGISISSTSGGNRIEANYIGTDTTGTIARPNSGSGVQVLGSSGNIIGGPSPTQRNVISGGGGGGIAIRSGSTNTLVQGNNIGTNALGTAALGNGGNGIFIGESSNNVIDGNVISGNGTVGVNVQASLQAPFVATGNVITGNRIGTTAAGTAAIPNGQSGIFIGNAATNTTIGGTTAAARNVISGNTGSGVTLSGATTTGNVVSGNYIGTDVSGLAALPNNALQSGVFIINSPGNTIGGVSPGSGNVISGNAQHALTVVNATSSGNVIQGNLIGVDATGNTRLANGGIGLDIVSAVNTTVGGAGLAANVISGNGTGVQIRTGATGNTLAGNLIGVGVNGTAAIGNSGHGVQIIDAGNNTIGMVNTIANNGGFGVNVEGATSVSNTIRVNSIYNNQRGIDLGDDGPTANDPGDGDTGPNNLQNFPVIAVAAIGSTIIDGTFNSTPGTTFTLDFYASTACGTPQGQRYLGFAVATTDEAGLATYQAVLAPTAVIGEYITGTATDPAGNTSEFSNCAQVGGAATFDLAVAQVRAPTQPVVDTDTTYTITVTNNGPFTVAGVALVDILPPGATFINVNGNGCQQDSGTVTCALGTLAVGASAIVEVVVRPTQDTVVLVNTVSVAGDGIDSNPANNTSQDSAPVSSSGACASPGFAGPSSYLTDSTGIGILAAGDFNNDGRQDVAVTETSNQVALFLGSDSGGFDPPIQIPIGSNPTSVFASDFDNDGNLDLAVSAGVTNDWRQLILLGDGDGGFTQSASLMYPFSTFQLGAADFNDDGNVDLVATSASTSDLWVMVWLGLGGGQFDDPTQYSAGSAAGNIVIADFNHNGTLDIAVPNVGGTTVSILNGNGNGTFAAPVAITVQHNANTVQRLREVGDVNLDGWEDLGVVTSATAVPGNLMLLLNAQNGSFQPATEIIGPIGVGSLASGDFNGDGDPDLAVISFQTNQLVIMQGDGTGAFTQAAAYLTGPGQNHVVATDLTNDGRLDLVGTLRGAIYTLSNVCSGTAGSIDLATTISGPAAGTAGDNLTYTVTTTNNGPAEATAVVATVVVPTGMNYVGSVGLTCTENWGTVSCLMPPIAADASVAFDVQVHAFGAGARVMRAMAQAGQADSEPSNDIGSVTTTLAASPQTFVVTNTADAGKGSLRQAIADANTNTGSTNTIAFNIAGEGPFTIAPFSNLGNVTNPVIIDGTTQPGFGGVPIVELSGINSPTSGGLTITAGGSTVRGLVINRWSNGIVLTTNGNNVVEGNYIGTNLAGTAAAGNSTTGVVAVSPNNRIGGTTAAQRNVISGNTVNGVNVSGQVANGALVNSGAGTQVIGNYIGTNASGTAVITGAAANSVGVRVAANNVIVGTPSGPNVISGNTGSGVFATVVTPSTGSTVVLTNSSGLRVRSNLIGTNAAGTSAIPNGTGVSIGAGNAIIIGGNSLGEGNVISGNSGNGVSLGITTTNNGTVYVAQASGVNVLSNIIGLNAAGTAALPNVNGVQVSVSSNTVGGSSANARNVISGNTGVGVNITNTTTPVSIVAQGNQVLGNYVGLNAAGDAVIGNGGSGIASNGNTNLIGLDSAGAGNVIVGNGAASNGAGINLFGGSNHTVRGNFIGTNPAGTAAMPNAFRGVLINNSNNNTIGGSTSGARNIVSGNGIAPSGGHGVEVIGTSSGNTIYGNYIGTDSAGGAALPNRSNGIVVRNSTSSTTIGGAVAGEANVISGNLGVGVQVDSGAGATFIRGNYVGLNAAGTSALGNTVAGINAASGVAIGGLVAGAGNVISGNGTVTSIANGIHLSSGTGSTIQGNLIGTNATGTAAVPNTGHGVQIVGSSNNTVGGSGTAARNVISGNARNGIEINSSSANVIQGNYIGVNAAGTAALGNQVGIIDAGTGTSIGGTTVEARNVISGNSAFGGVHLAGNNAILAGNYIGTNATGDAALPNGSFGGVFLITVGTSGNSIGGTTAGAGNLISGNAGPGIQIGQATGTVVQNNRIGTTAAGGPLGNTGNGVSVSTNNNIIGGASPSLANTIANNGGIGVSVSSGTGNLVRSNSIAANGSIGIDLGANGPTGNDVNDADGGANDLQNYPALTFASAGASTVVDGTINTTPSTAVSLDFFASASCDASGSGEGERYLGSIDVVTNANGDATFQAVLSAATAVGEAVTAIATSASGTSEFSACRLATPD